jgi:anti-repressor protein
MIDKTELRLAKTFNFEGMNIQIFWEGEDPWFLASEICAALGYKNPRTAISRHVKDQIGGITKRDTPTLSGVQLMTYISEPSFYDLARHSKKPAADKLYREVNHNILPTLRKRGIFIDGGNPFGSKEITNPSMVAQMFEIAAKTIRQLENDKQAMTPLYQFGNELKSTDNLFTATEVAKELGVSAQCLNRFLHDKKIIFKHRGCWVPYTNYDGADYFKKVNTTIIKTDSGESFQRHSLKITAKGQELIHRLWREHKAKLLSGKPLELDLKTA